MTLRVGAELDSSRLRGERWFADSAAAPVRAVVEERIDLPGGGTIAVARVALGARPPTWYTVLGEPAATTWAGLGHVAAGGTSVRGQAGWLLRGLAPRAGAGAGSGRRAGAAARVRPMGVDQSNSTAVIDETWALKLYRRLRPGRNPEVELAAALGAVAGAPVPAFGGGLTLEAPRGGQFRGRADLAVLQRYAAGSGDEFERLADAIADWLRRGGAARDRAAVLAELPSMGAAVGAMHDALGRLRGRAMSPRPAGPGDVSRWTRRADRALATAIRAIRPIDPSLAAELAGRGPAIEAALQTLGDEPQDAVLTRIHGDLHVGQLLRDVRGQPRGGRFLVGDFEGEPTRPLAERRRRDLPARDVASMLRSLDHVARSGARRAGWSGPAATIDGWIAAARTSFTGAYAARVGPAAATILEPRRLRALELEKELYEFTYAASYLPAWRYAPAAGLRWLMDTEP